MKSILIKPVLLAGLLFVCKPALASTLEFPTYGFKLDALEAPLPATTVAPLVMLLPGSNGFAPNVNVAIQPYTDTMENYAKLSKTQFAEAGWTVVSEKLNDPKTLILEYKDATPGKEMHFYAKAISNGTAVYLVTATAKEDQWAANKDALVKCVDSLALMPAAP